MVAEKGVDVSMIKTCRKIRKLAKLDRITLDETTHRSGLNKHLFDYIKYCGLEPLLFIKEYLANIQPYMILRRSDQEPDKDFLCIIDNAYCISVYIKLNTKQYEEIIVSFHEDNKRGVAKTNSLQKIDLQKYVPVFADSILGKVENENRYVVKVFCQRGMKILPLELSAIRCEDVFIVQRHAIDMQFISYCNDYIKDLYTSNLDLDFDKIEVFSVLQQISFTSYGKDTFSSVSLLIDSINIQHDFISRGVADSALVTYVQNLNLTDCQQTELIQLLQEKYKVTSMKNVDLILKRIEDNLSLAYKTVRSGEGELKKINSFS